MEDRREDWRRSIDENLASLNSGQRVWDRQIERVEKELSAIRDLLHGDAHGDTDGMVARLHETENAVQLLRAVLLKDAAGNGGIQGRIERLEDKKERRRELWGNITKIAVALIMSGAVLKLWPSISRLLNQPLRDPVDQKIEAVRHPPDRYRHYTVRQLEEPPEPTPNE